MMKSRSTPSQRLSLFDLDKTLIRGNSSFLFGSFLYKKGEISSSKALQLLFSYASYKIGYLPLLLMQERIFELYFHGRNATRISDLAEQFVEENVGTILYTPAVTRLRLAQEEGHFTALLSSGPSFLVGPFARYFKVDFWGSTQYSSVNEHFSSITKGLLGEDKKTYMLQLAKESNVEPEETIAYSDSIEDLPFLEAAGRAVGVNPDQKLLHICRTRNWEII